MARSSGVKRKTKETSIELNVNLDGGAVNISTGVGFFDHMLELFAFHSGFGLEIKAEGDIHIDAHHTVEDIGIALGKAICESAGDKKGITRYGFFLLPMDEALVEVALDFSGRSWLHLDLPFTGHKCGDFDLQLIGEFFQALASNAKITLHIIKRYGNNDHHTAEAAFKAVGRAMKAALQITSAEIPSSKGVL